MELVNNKNKKLIIDRTIPEILKKNPYVSQSKLIKFSYLLNEVGVNLIEIDSDVLKIIEKLPKDLNFIYRIKKQEIITRNLLKNFKHVVIRVNDFLNFKLKDIYKLKEMKIIFEVDIDDLKKIKDKEELCIDITSQKLKFVKDILKLNNESYIRINGLSKSILGDWESTIGTLKNNFNMKIDVCPGNKFKMATAVALEAFNEDTDSITMSFLGNGDKYGFAAMEEVILALNKIYGYNLGGNTCLFSELSKEYQDVTGNIIPGSKPILGKDIFKYESGIHADGIDKSPNTYEPYDPKDVGQSRKMIIGKHSGSVSVMKKLRELNINYEKINIKALLEEIRERSIQLKGEIIDEELIKLSMNCR
ncbi:2-isopropylmalate synthase [Clostridium homopropionicum DSM 5847]|uniref:2-isopropylmalate synthase n=1 Tax=Clostridium homopropionicum DSM 5847 TaxID=1121318 RepID=A0A0L6ZE32_9CLOT|nr:hypothetical protein [Clostridium homopropionicum]KOA21197.1 2-isopropylmalate synthase [Clostridium homopropionicum DSM 5847]SFG26916.1 homocitrate synthase NifV [Clostridium homopropionicum]